MIFVSFLNTNNKNITVFILSIQTPSPYYTYTDTIPYLYQQFN